MAGLSSDFDAADFASEGFASDLEFTTFRVLRMT
jgi:hypothetical protein